MPRHHRPDEYGRPTDQSLVQNGYETPTMSWGAVRAGLIGLVLVAAALYFIF